MHFFDLFNHAEISVIQYSPQKLCINKNLLVKCKFGCKNIKNKFISADDYFEDKIFSKFDSYFKIFKRRKISHVNLKENPEFNTNFKEGKIFWTELKKSLPVFILHGLNFSITNHIAAKYYQEKFSPSLNFFYSQYGNLQKNKKYFFQYGNVLFSGFLQLDKFNFFSEKIEFTLKKFNFYSKKNLQLKKWRGGKINFDEILSVLNCMGCDRCHLWSTVQFTGLECAYKLCKGIRVSKHETKCLLNSLKQYILAYKYYLYMESRLTLLFFVYYYRIYIFGSIFIILIIFNCK